MLLREEAVTDRAKNFFSFGNVATTIYILGYWLFVIAAAVFYWPISQSFEDWRNYVGWQMLYGIAWPILLLIQSL